jgi:hypothetical protein
LLSTLCNTYSQKSSKTFLVGSIGTLTPEPSSLVPKLENTATLRLFGQDDFSDWIFTEDHREKSVWVGFAAVGGFWTFINGAFKTLFGSHLILLLFGALLKTYLPDILIELLTGIRPFSIVGLLDFVQRRKYRTFWGTKYSNPERFFDEKGQRTFAAFLLEDIFNLDFIKPPDEDGVEQQPDGNGGKAIPLADAKGGGHHVDGIPP